MIIREASIFTVSVNQALRVSMEEQRARQEAEERKAASESAAAGAAEPGAGRSLSV